MSVKSLSEKRFHTLDVDDRWKFLIGLPERNFRMIIYGPSTSGKSSLALECADMLAKRIGKVLYNSWEEGQNKTFQDRIRERKIDAAKLFVADRLPFDEMVDKTKRNHYRALFIDSLKFMDFGISEYKNLTATYPKKAMIFLGHGDKLGQLDFGKDILKACDIKIFINNGKAHITSRYLGETKEVELFKVKKISLNPTQPQLL